MESPNESITLSRIFSAPRELVFKAWTEPERLAEWWGPKGFTMEVAWMDLRPGGVFHYRMRSSNGMEMWGKFVYREVTPPERLVFVNSISDEEANAVRNPYAPDWPLEIQSTLTLEERDGQTMLTMTGIPINATKLEREAFVAGSQNVQAGFRATWDQLDEYLARELKDAS
ncbi:MAG: SRPBCC domain-containing protein [Bacteroidetes bacterium]|nr:SRPBCC domain-containing protein [Bacteroidota bacterium]